MNPATKKTISAIIDVAILLLSSYAAMKGAVAGPVVGGIVAFLKEVLGFLQNNTTAG